MDHNNYPLAPSHLEIPIKGGSSRTIRKLAPNFTIGKYVVYIENLQYYLQKGLVLKKVHRAVRFEQKAWLKPYIQHNIKLRQQASWKKDKFRKQYYKDMNNSFYGKTMENVRDRVNIQFSLTKEHFKKWTSSPLFSFKGNNPLILHEDGLSIIKTSKKEVILDKPIYIGACVLDLSKLLMFKFHYDTMREKYSGIRHLLPEYYSRIVS